VNRHSIWFSILSLTLLVLLYRQNTEVYLAEIDETDAYVRQQITRIPAEKRLMITAPDAFGYFAKAYGLEVAGLQGISTESEARSGWNIP